MPRSQSNPTRWVALLLFVALLAGAAAARGASRTGRERAAEQIPELMGRILESQEEIRDRQSEIAPEIARYDQALADARGRVERATDEDQATSALVDYVEAYDQRADLQADGLRAIQGPILRMRADSKELVHAAKHAGVVQDTPELRRPFLEDQFQGIATGLSQLASSLGREEEAGIAGSVLHAGWASQNTPELPLVKLGPDGAQAFAQRAEGLYARYQARSAQLRAERRAVRQLLDLLIQRQLGARLESLFDDDGGLGVLLAASGKTQDWNELGSMVRRAIGMPSDGDDWSAAEHDSLADLEFFASGNHVQQ
jgi:hypothetical protein